MKGAAATAVVDIAAANLAWGDDESLATKLAKRDAKELTRSTFNFRPDEQEYPKWFKGDWETTITFRGYEFPRYESFPKTELVQDVPVAGFQKLSIAQLVDVGKASTSHRTRWVESAPGGAVVEDRAFNLKSGIDATLGIDGAVSRVEYDARRDPNRCSLVFREGATRNAERIELFTNGRASTGGGSGGDDLFFTSESVRQVTFSASRDLGVARQVVTEYQYFWTHRWVEAEKAIRSNLLTCAYLEPQDPNFFKVPINRPVAVYSHNAEHRQVL